MTILNPKSLHCKENIFTQCLQWATISHIYIYMAFHHQKNVFHFVFPFVSTFDELTLRINWCLWKIKSREAVSSPLKTHDHWGLIIHESKELGWTGWCMLLPRKTGNNWTLIVGTIWCKIERGQEHTSTVLHVVWQLYFICCLGQCCSDLLYM